MDDMLGHISARLNPLELLLPSGGPKALFK